MKNLKLFGFLLATWVLGACSKDPTTYKGSRVLTFTVDNEDLYATPDKILQADYMFVVDVSASMGFNSANLADPDASKREEFLGGLGNFVDSLEDENINYRFGFINGNVHAGRKSSLSGRGFYQNILVDGGMGNSYRDGLIDQLQGLGQTLNENTNLMLEAADTVMSNTKGSFIRPGSQLIYIFVSDTDDESPSYITGKDTSTIEYASRLIAHKGSGNTIPAFVSARSIVAGVNSGCQPENDFGEQTGTRLAGTAAEIERRGLASTGITASVSPASVSHCILRASTEFPQLLEQLARDVSKPTNVFALQVSNVVVNSIKVYKDGVKLDNSEWSYLNGTNAVKLKTMPSPSSRIRLTYNQYFVLNGAPVDVNAIEVKTNGSILPSNSSGGWTYNAAANRIEFSDALPNGTVIEVSF